MSKLLQDKISSTLYDLTHLEINTIIKDEMSASKAPASARLLLHSIATKYDEKLVSLADKYKGYVNLTDDCTDAPKYEDCHKLKSADVPKGSGYESFCVLSCRANFLGKKLLDKKVTDDIQEDLIDADINMLQRIETISDDIRRILKMEGVVPKKGTDKKEIYDFDVEATANKFRALTTREAEQYELNLDLRQFMLIKKANDIGTERVILQTIIGIDGDVTTRISQAFANQPVTFINDMHHEAIGISVKFWENLVNVVVKLGESLINNLTGKKRLN